MSKVIAAPLTQVELRRAILEFAQGRDTGYLGTAGPGGVHVSPVKYFIDPELNIYIHSRGEPSLRTWRSMTKSASWFPRRLPMICIRSEGCSFSAEPRWPRPNPSFTRWRKSSAPGITGRR